MYILIITLPLMSALITGLFGRYLGTKGVLIIAVSCMTLSLLTALFIFFEVSLSGGVCMLDLFTWINSGVLYVKWSLLFDGLTSVMLVVVIFISLLVHIFTINYMRTDPHLNRFVTYLTLFTFFMIVLVTAANFVQMFVGWEGVGLASYLLINFWFTRHQANKAAIKAIILNRIGDFGLILGIAGIFSTFKSLDYYTVFSLVDFVDRKLIFFSYRFDAVTFITIFLFIGAMGKSAQIGLHVWLPDAMEGPTPVSALIHAATMVTAGVFLLIRCSPIIEKSTIGLAIIAVVGATTAFFASTVGLVQNDIKKIVAYSTCSQLGYMVFAVGLSCYSASFYHLVTHAFFKALLFLSCGSLIHALNDEQDIRKMGGLVKVLPFSYTMMLIGSLSLMGVPFLSGFYSKDVILEIAFAGYYTGAMFAYWLGIISAFFTAFYSFRLLYFVFLTRTNSYKKYMENIHEGDFFIIFPLLILSLGSIFIGYILRDLLIGVGTDFWGNTISIKPENTKILIAENLPPLIKLIPVFVGISGSLSALVLYKFFNKVIYNKFYKKKPGILYQVFYFLNKKWYFDILYYRFITKILLEFGRKVTFEILDRGAFELLGPLGLVRFINKLIKKVNNLNTGKIYHYFLMVGLGFFFILIMFYLTRYLKFVTLDYDILLLAPIFWVILNWNIKNQKK